MFDRTREFFAKLFTPVARFLLARGVSPDVVTIVGTLGVCAGSLVFFPTGHLLIGVLVITVFVFSDTVDGVMARMQGRSSKWGAFLDSTLDRFGDAAIFSGLVFYYMGVGDSKVWAGFALACLVMGSLTSYARARAEGLGMTAKGGIAERADRLVSVLVAAGFSGMGVPYILEVVLVLLAVASSITVVQRILIVRRQALPPAAPDAIESTAMTAAAATDDAPSERPGGQPPEPPVAPSNAAPSNSAQSNAGTTDPAAEPPAGPSTQPLHRQDDPAGSDA
jgi:CDP-diacylglycerol--glycerol-3-phosphate 3-phosphatidyltransferase